MTSRILVIAPQWIGDAVMTEPLLRALRARGGTITVAALPWVAPVFRCMSAVCDVLELPFQRGRWDWNARRALGQQLRGQFDSAYVCPNSWKGALLPWFARVPHRIGYLGEARWGLLNDRRPNPPRNQRLAMVTHYLHLLGQPSDAELDRHPTLAVDPQHRTTLLAQHGFADDAYLVLVPGAEYGPAKRWPAEHFAALAAMVRSPVVILGSPKEQSLCADIAAKARAQGKSCLNLAGHTSLEQAMVWLGSAGSVVSNDSGLMHVAAALGRHQIAVFGSSSPRHTPPRNAAAQVVWLKDDVTYQPPLDCAPCFARQCRFGHTRCLHDISPSHVRGLLSIP